MRGNRAIAEYTVTDSPWTARIDLSEDGRRASVTVTRNQGTTSEFRFVTANANIGNGVEQVLAFADAAWSDYTNRFVPQLAIAQQGAQLLASNMQTREP